VWETLAEYAIQFLLLLLLTTLPVALVALGLSWLLVTFAWRRFGSRVQEFWRGPGAAVAIVAWIAFTIGVFLALNFADDFGIEPV
jgi:energy-coupling factor transporter transmembrane protein EcfT